MYTFRLLLLTAATLACLTAFAPSPRAADGCCDLAQLVTMMTGHFTSAKQAAADEDYFDITLHMVPIWRERSDAHWLYVEQAVTGMADKPYRQRVYRVSQRGDVFESAVFELPEPEKYIGTWRDDIPLADIGPADLIERPGCAVYLCKTGPCKFSGSTPGSDCLSSLYGAAYATSEVTITKDQVISWDRGYDPDGKQVWGAEKGPYVFDRQPEPAKPVFH
jgi:hypothetical protein